MDDILKHKKLRRPKQKPARLATLQLPLAPCWSELGLKLPDLLFSEDQNYLQSCQNLVPKPPRCLEPSRKSKAARKAAGAEKDTGTNKGPLAESWRVVEDAGAAYRSALADELAGLGMVVTGGACAKMLPIPQTSYCVLPAIKSSSRTVEPIRASASKTPGPLGCRATPDGRESAYSSPPLSPPPSPPPSSPPSPPPSLPLPPCRPEAQSPGSSPPPTLNDPVTQETTPSLLSSEETGDELSVLICLDAEVMARVGNLASSSSEDQEVTTGSLDPESGLTNQEVGQPEMDDNENADYPDDFHKEEKGEDDGAAGLPEEVQDHPSLPVSPSETPSLQPREVLIQEKVLMPPQPSALHHQTLHDLLHRLVGRLALQGPLRSCFTPTNSEIEAILFRDVSWFLWNQAGIGLVLEHEPQNPLFGGADALDAMFEATYADLMLCSDSNRAQVHSALQGGAGIVCMAENVATVICRHAEVWRPSAVSGESPDLETGYEERESTEDSAGLEKAGGSSSPFMSNRSLDEGLEMDSAGLEKASRLASCLSSSSTSRSCYPSSSSTSGFSSPSSSKSSTSSSSSRGSMARAPIPEEDHLGLLGKIDPPILTMKKEKTDLKDGQKAAKGKKSKKIFKTNKVSPFRTECPDSGESSIARGEEKNKKKTKSIKSFFRGVSAALSRAFCFGCIKDIQQ